MEKMQEGKNKLKGENTNPEHSNMFKNILCVCVLSAAAILVVLYFISDNYPLRFRKNLDYILGKGNWSVVDNTHKETSLAREERSYRKSDMDGLKTGSYKTWTILFTKQDGTEEEVRLSNLNHKSKNSSKFPFSPKYVSNKASFGMGILETAEYIAQENLKENIFPSIFEPQEYEFGSPKLGETGVGTAISFYQADKFDKSYYEKIVEKGTCFDLTDFHEEELMKTGNYYVNILIRTYQADAEMRTEIDRKAEQLNEELKNAYNDISYNLAVYHYSEAQDYNSTAIDSADHVEFYFAYQGKAVSREEVQEATDTYWLEGSVPDIKYYIQGKNKR